MLLGTAAQTGYGKKNLGPPFGFVLLLFLFFGAILAGIGVLIVFLISRALKVKLRTMTRLSVIGLFLFLLPVSTLWVRGRIDGVTVTYFGSDDVYEGVELSYGSPLIFMGIFYASNASNVNAAYSLFPHNFYIEAFLFDFIFWLVIATITLCIVEKNRSQRHPAS